MSKATHVEELGLIELGQDIVYPPVPDISTRVRARIAAGNVNAPGRAIRRPVLIGLGAAVAILISVLVFSPGARATLMPWWGSDSSCPGAITGEPLHLKDISASELCRQGIVLTQPTGKPTVSRRAAATLVQRRLRDLRLSEEVLVTVHQQRLRPPTTRLAWAVSMRPARARIAAKRRIRIVLFVGARSGQVLVEARSVVGSPYPQLQEPRFTYTNILFPNRRDGFIEATKRGGTQYLLTTTNDGESWTRLHLRWNIEWIQFVNESEGWMVGAPACRCHQPNILYRTLDGGRTWRKLMSLNGIMPQIQFGSATRGWMRFSHGRTLDTDNGGLAWSRVKWPFPAYSAWSFRNAQVGWASASVRQSRRHLSGCVIFQLYVTFNGGRSWSKRPGKPGCYSLPVFTNARDGWMLVDPHELNTSGPYRGALFEGNSNCIHDDGCPQALLRTVDGGRSWTTEHPVSRDEAPSEAQLESGEPVGKFWPGGNTWNFGAMRFVNPSRGWLVLGNPAGGAPPPRGMSGGVSVTADGGKTWRVHHLGFGSVTLTVVSAREAWATVQNYFVQANRSYVLHTTDGGKRWKVVRPF